MMRAFALLLLVPILTNAQDIGKETERFSTGKVGCVYATTKIQELDGSEMVECSQIPRNGFTMLFPTTAFLFIATEPVVGPVAAAS